VTTTLNPESTAEFDRLLATCLPSAVPYAFAIMRNRQDAEDAVQEAAINAMRAFSRFDAAHSFKAWWLTILRNACRDRRRRSSRLMRMLERLVSPAPESQVDEWVRSDAVGGALSRLPERHREILELKYFAECSYDEIANILAIPKGTVMSRLHAARQEFERHYSRGES